MNKRTIALTTEQYKEIIQTMREGFCGCRPNERIATALVLEGNLGLRISDILSLRLSDIVRDGDRYRLEITEQKTKKKRVCDYLGFEGIGTHSFRKWYATEIYKKNGYDITLVQRLLQHSSAAITQRYIGIEPQRIEEAIEGHAQLL